MVASPMGFLFLNILYLVLFLVDAIIFMVLSATERRQLARRILGFPYVVLGLLGAIFFIAVASVSSILALAVPFALAYIIFAMVGVYVLLWKPKEKIPLVN
ncbi:hypothetical protein ApAK_07585 [Thermoplasmatales archaeon AK]|nr:hypothetical protein [Thermoplasmatales archaeon AK]